jgi:hypothetical protein
MPWSKLLTLRGLVLKPATTDVGGFRQRVCNDTLGAALLSRGRQVSMAWYCVKFFVHSINHLVEKSRSNGPCSCSRMASSDARFDSTISSPWPQAGKFTIGGAAGWKLLIMAVSRMGGGQLRVSIDGPSGRE